MVEIFKPTPAEELNSSKNGFPPLDANVCFKENMVFAPFGRILHQYSAVEGGIYVKDITPDKKRETEEIRINLLDVVIDTAREQGIEIGTNDHNLSLAEKERIVNRWVKELQRMIEEGGVFLTSSNK